MSFSRQFTELHESLRRRRRPEDIAQLIQDFPELSLSRSERMVVEKAARGALRRSFLGFTSMTQDFAEPVGCFHQLRKGLELFPGMHFSNSPTGSVSDANFILMTASPEIRKTVGESDFLANRLNRIERKSSGLDISKRQYNKRFRFLRRLERKRDRLILELKKREFTFASKSRLASKISFEEFSSNAASAAFIAYYTARCNLRSEFTVSGQERPYDEIADTLFQICRKERKHTNWWAIAQVFPDLEVLSHLSNEEKGKLLGTWFGVLEDVAKLLRKIWNSCSIDRGTMIVRRGNDSTTWNNTAGAWNKARDSWFNLIYSLGMDEIVDFMCPGKVLRLMAADVVEWHRVTGNTLEEDTKIWCSLPLPWEVIDGSATCTKEFVQAVCKKHRVDPVRKGWISPRPDKHVASFRPTPELVHGVTISHPGLALFLRKAGYFSGKGLKN